MWLLTFMTECGAMTNNPKSCLVTRHCGLLDDRYLGKVQAWEIGRYFAFLWRHRSGLEPKLDHPPPTKPWQGDLKPTHQGKSSKKGCCARVIRRGGLWQKLEVCLVATKNAFLQQKKILANAILLLQEAIHKSSKKHQLNWKCCNFAMQGNSQKY